MRYLMWSQFVILYELLRNQRWSLNWSYKISRDDFLARFFWAFSKEIGKDKVKSTDGDVMSLFKFKYDCEKKEDHPLCTTQ